MIDGLIDFFSYVFFLYIPLSSQFFTERNKEGKAEGKRFNQIVAKWFNRNEFGLGALYLSSGAIGASW